MPNINRLEPIRHVGIVCRPDSPPAISLALQIIKHLEKNQIKVTPEINLAEKSNLTHGKALNELNCDVIVTVGGDGTVLHTCMNIRDPETPLLVINMGRRGYLSEVDSDQALDAIQQLLTDNYHLEKHSKLSIYLNDQHLADGLNEILVISSSPSKMLRCQLLQGKVKLVRIRGDGLIVSTPTGSTAHAFSAGGPILLTTLNAFNIVFLSPIDPIKSIITPDTEPLQIQLVKGVGATLAIDGRIEQSIPIGSTLTIQKAHRSAVFIRFKDNFSARRLRRLIQYDPSEEK